MAIFNKKNLKQLVVFIFLLFTLSAILENVVLLDQYKIDNLDFQNDTIQDLKTAESWTLSPFIIDDIGGGDYTWAEAAIEDWCSGSGTWNDPYTINNVTVNGRITVRDSNAYFIFNNCTAGFDLQNVWNGKLTNNYGDGVGGNGINLGYSYNNSIIGNSENNNYRGIMLDHSNNNTLINNTANTNWVGINLDRSHNNSLIMNTANYNDYGFSIHCSQNNTIRENLCYNNNQDGIKIDHWASEFSAYNIVLKNNISANLGNGILITSLCIENLIYRNYIINNNIQAQDDGSNNSWDSGTIGNYWSNYGGVDVNDDGIGDTPYSIGGTAGSQDNYPIWSDGFDGGYVSIDGSATGIGAHNWTWAESRYWCSGKGTFGDPYIIKNLYIDAASGSIGILIENSNVYFQIINCTVRNVANSHPYGNIKLINTNNGVVRNNTVTGSYYGIYLQTSCDNNTIVDNIAYGNSDSAIHMRQNSHDNSFINNSVKNNGWGLYFYDNCDNNLISGNFFENNNALDIVFSTDIDYNNITYNKIIDGGNGVNIYHTDCSGNRFIFNNFSLMTGLDRGVGNLWDNGSIGNYWSVYSGTDADDNGIGDSAYNVPDSGNGRDYYPIFEDGDDLEPNITIITPHINSFYETSAPNFEVIIDEFYLDSAWYTVGGSPNMIFQGNMGAINQTLWDSVIDGTVSLIFYINDSAGRIAYDSVDVTKDTAIPNIHLISPSPNQVFDDASPSFTIMISDPNLDMMWYTIDDGFTNLTFTVNGTIDQNNWTAQVDGPITLLFYANDTLGHVNSTQVIINKDTTSPIINIISPNPDQLFGETSPSFSVEVYDLNLNTMWYTIDGGLTNITFTFNGTIDHNNWTAHIDGPVMIIFYANDTLGHINSAQVIINKDTTSPIINIISPNPDQLFGETSPSFSVEVYDLNLNTMWYTIDGGLTNITFTFNGTIDHNNWTAHIDGPVTIIFYANDTLGHINSAQVIINKDTTSPIINIISPSQNQLFASNSPDFIVEISGANLDTMWYTINNGMDNFTFSENGTINQAIWNLMSNGTVTIKFYANNSFGKITLQEVMVTKDIDGPIISIDTPTMNEVFEIPPAYEITITEANLDKIWYSFDGGSNIMFITGLIGVIDLTLWNQLPNGYVTIRFYANDTLGNISFDEVIVVKDTPTPSPPPGGIPGYNVIILLGMISLISAFIIRRKFNRK